MIVQVHLHSILRDGRFEQSDIGVEREATVEDLLKLLNIKTDDVGIVMINGSSGTFVQILGDGDRITLIPHLGGG